MTHENNDTDFLHWKLLKIDFFNDTDNIHAVDQKKEKERRSLLPSRHRTSLKCLIDV